MAAGRKLQAEVDKVMKKVEEGIEEFQNIWDNVHNASQPNQREKFENELKAQIKKLQRDREQIKIWLNDKSIKDKNPLTEARKRIENDMERFKDFERDAKTKTYSKEGLSKSDKVDPHEEERNKHRTWIQDYMDKLNVHIDEIDADLETQVQTTKKSRKKDDDSDKSHLKLVQETHRWHATKLEQMLRKLDNDDVTMEDLDELRDSVEYYVDENSLDKDMYQTFDTIYEAFGLEDVEDYLSKDKDPKHKAEEEEDVEDSASAEVKPDKKAAKEDEAAAAPAKAAKSPKAAPSSATPTPTAGGRRKGDADKEAAPQKPWHPAQSVWQSLPPAVPPPMEKAAPPAAAAPGPPPKPGPPAGAAPPPPGPREFAGAPGPPPPHERPPPERPPPPGQAPVLHAPLGQPPPRPALQPQPPQTAPPTQAPPQPPLHAPPAGGPPHMRPPAAPGTAGAAPLPAPPAAPPPAPQEGAPPSGARSAPAASAAPAPSEPPSLAPPPPPPVMPPPPPSLASTMGGPPQSVPAMPAAEPARSKPPPPGVERKPPQKSPPGPHAAPPPPTASPPPPPPTVGHSAAAEASAASPGGGAASAASALPGWMPPAPTLGSGHGGAVSADAQDGRAGAGLAAGGQGGSARSGRGDLCGRPSPSTRAELSCPEEGRFQDLLDASWRNLPAMFDRERERKYVPRNPYVHADTRGKAAYPVQPTSGYQDPAMFEKYDLDTLFFIFYYQQGTYQQHLAARELKKLSWRYNTKYFSWFLRHQDPVVVESDFEQGSYVYFDVEKEWCQRIKHNFKFEYEYLEDEPM